ncbi:hypothetical protein [Pseudoxanthomonas kaohsiungensis]|uniref:Outer membrane protein beta-barrel domain-containing protein n=1 Tax=Pseudoxanthomonas kaohsiungensis TaxID=283923 RepID=A0ABW3LR75_9GAMM|nr:hypothetical protein [Pseudoxanthomonas kaohsiungensis]KAF1704130.1 hypothetical protein CSC66_04555 [Pseudoxanthomonas kaohsiungensis]
MRNLLLAALLGALPFTASAADGISYDYIEAGWTQFEINDDWLGDPDGDGGYLRGSFSIARNVHLFGAYATVSTTYDYDDARIKYELAQPEFGIGYHQEMTGNLDFTADLAWVRVNGEVKVSGTGDPDLDGTYKDHTNAGRVTTGVRGKPSPRTELWLKGGYLDGSDLDGSFVGTLGGQLAFTPAWGLVGEVEVIEDTTRFNVGIRASF